MLRPHLSLSLRHRDFYHFANCCIRNEWAIWANRKMHDLPFAKWNITYIHAMLVLLGFSDRFCLTRLWIFRFVLAAHGCGGARLVHCSCISQSSHILIVLRCVPTSTMSFVCIFECAHNRQKKNSFLELEMANEKSDVVDSNRWSSVEARNVW